MIDRFALPSAAAIEALVMTTLAAITQRVATDKALRKSRDPSRPHPPSTQPSRAASPDIP